MEPNRPRKANGVDISLSGDGGGSARAVSPRVSRQRLHLQRAPARPGGRRLSRRRAVHAGICAHHAGAGRPVSVGPVGPGCGGAHRRAGGRARLPRRPRLGGRGHVWRGRARPRAHRAHRHHRRGPSRGLPRRPRHELRAPQGHLARLLLSDAERRAGRGRQRLRLPRALVARRLAGVRSRARHRAREGDVPSARRGDGGAQLLSPHVPSGESRSRHCRACRSASARPRRRSRRSPCTAPRSARTARGLRGHGRSLPEGPREGRVPGRGPLRSRGAPDEVNRRIVAFLQATGGREAGDRESAAERAAGATRRGSAA